MSEDRRIVTETDPIEEPWRKASPHEEKAILNWIRAIHNGLMPRILIIGAFSLVGTTLLGCFIGFSAYGGEFRSGAMLRWSLYLACADVVAVIFCALYYYWGYIWGMVAVKTGRYKVTEAEVITKELITLSVRVGRARHEDRPVPHVLVKYADNKEISIRAADCQFDVLAPGVPVLLISFKRGSMFGSRYDCIYLKVFGG